MYYLALIEGRGEGCDYTIGCNVTWRFLDKANNFEEAEKEVKKIWINDDRIKSIEVIEYDASLSYNNYDKLFAKEIEEGRKQKEAEELAAKEAEFERLKKELGK